MHEGRIQQWDRTWQLYHQPANRFVADCVGQGVFVPGRVAAANRVEFDLGSLLARSPIECGRECMPCGRGCEVDILLRPDDVKHDDAGPLLAEVERKALRGAEILYTLRLPSGTRVLSLVPSHHDHAIGQRIGIRLDVDHVVTFRSENAVMPLT